MSDFMKSVVSEALRGTKTVVTKSTAKIPESAQSPKQIPSSTNKGSLDQIIRPNYQNKNVQKRLSVLGQQQEAPISSHTRVKPTEENKTPKTLHAISELRKVSLSQGKIGVEQPGYQPPPATQEKAKLIGSEKDGTSVWFFPSVHPNLASMFHRTTTGQCVIVVNAKTCFPSQLLLLNELLNTYPDLKYHLTWSKTNNQPFTLELYSANTSGQEKLAKDVYQQLTKRSIKSIDTFQVNSPSAWLSKQLGLMKSVETAGIGEGISYYNSLLLLDHYLKAGHDSTVSLQVEENYLLIAGKSKEVNDALAILKKLADRL